MSLPNLEEFLDVIDPKKTLDRKKVLGKVTAVSLMRAVIISKEHISEKGREEIKKIYDEEGLNFEKMHSVFKRENKLVELNVAVLIEADNTRNDYMKTHIEELTQDKKEKLFELYPDLQSII